MVPGFGSGASLAGLDQANLMLTIRMYSAHLYKIIEPERFLLIIS
jgi:hypothetical protein